MAFHCVSYNIHFGFGMDGRYELGRIADAVRGADIIALQEVSRNNPENGGADMVAELCSLLPEYFHVFGAPFHVDMGSAEKDGKAGTRFFEFGNMVLSKTPILAARNLLLPRSYSVDTVNLQRGALEAIIETPAGPVRIYSVHLDHTSPAERLMQIEFLKRTVLEYVLDGGAVTGQSSRGFPELPAPEHFLLMGDFNMLPDSPEYAALCGPVDHLFGRQVNRRYAVDVSNSADSDVFAGPTWFDPEAKLEPTRIDFCFASTSLAPHVTAPRIDSGAQGSDHRPVWVTLKS